MLKNRNKIQMLMMKEETTRYVIYEGVIKSASNGILFGFSDKPTLPTLSLEIEVDLEKCRTIIKHKMEISWDKLPRQYVDPLYGMKVKLYVTPLKDSSIINEIKLIGNDREIFMFNEDERFLSTWKHKDSKQIYLIDNYSMNDIK